MLVSLVWLSRILSPHEMGAYATGQAVIGILAALSALGLGAFIIREPRLDSQVLGSALAITLALSGLLAVVTFSGAPAMARLVGEPRLIAPLKLIALVPVINALELVPQALLQRDLRFGAVSIVSALRAAVASGVAIVTALLGDPYMCVAWAAVIASTASVIGSHMAAPGHLLLVPRFEHWRRMLPFGLKVLAVGGVSLLAVRSSELVLGSILGLAALGTFSRASAVYNTIYSSVFGAIGRVLMARLAIDQRRDVALRTSYVAGLHVTLAVMWPILLGIAVLAEPGVVLVFGTEWQQAASPLAILMIAQAIAMLFGMSYELFILRNQLGRQVTYEVTRSAAGLALFTIGCLFGLKMAALGRLAEAVLAAVLYVPQILRMMELSPREFARIVLVNGIVALATVAPAALLRFAIQASLSPFAVVLLSVGGGAVCWLLSIHLLKHPFRQELGNFISLLIRAVGGPGNASAGTTK
jgi:O-antigen/teichoic acid export membrane protein